MLDDLVRAQLAHFRDLIDERISIAGPPLKISSAAAQAIGLAMHELATNAGKYGALSNEQGRVEIAWHIDHNADDKPGFEMSWIERGGPRVTTPSRRGFGSTVQAAMPPCST